MISWDKQYERSVLAVSSDWIKAIVVKDFATLIALAEAAKSKKLPKLKIIPLDAIPKFKLTLPKEWGLGQLSAGKENNGDKNRRIIAIFLRHIFQI